MKGETILPRPCLPRLKNVLEEVRKLAHEKCYNIGTFCDAVWSFLAVLCDTPGGEALLTECGEFVLRNTADGTAYALAWKKGRERISQLAVGLEPAAEPQQNKAAKGVVVNFYSPPDIATEVLSGPVRELRAVAQQVEWVRQLESVRDWLEAVLSRDDLAEDVRVDLSEWHSDTTRVIGLGQGRCADGCRLLLDMHLRRLESEELAVLKNQELGPVSAGLILECAEFLYENGPSIGGIQQPGVKQGHVAGKEKRYRPPPCPKCSKSTKVTSTKSTHRNLRCRTCGHSWQESV